MSRNRNRTLTGRGIGVAVLDTGIYPHVDFDSRITAFKDVVNNRTSVYDDNSHGSHVSGIIAGSGLASNGKYAGTAYEADIIGVKILGGNGKGRTEDALKGIQWVLSNRLRYNIRIVNISFTSGKMDMDEENNPLLLAVEELWTKGIVVVIAAGNNGPSECSIGVPGISRKIITVGAYDNLYGRDENGKIKQFYSGRGCNHMSFIKPEIVARGSMITSCNNTRTGYTVKSGSSMAAPYVSGMIARLLEKYPDMEPIDVKLRLHDRAVSLGLPQNVQGWGTIDETLF